MNSRPPSGGATAPSPPAETSLPRISVQSLIGPDGIAGPERFQDLLRAATRQCRRLVDCESVRIWVSRSGGRRLVAHDFPDGGGPSQVLRMGRGEGLAGWVMLEGQALRLAPGDPLPPGITGPHDTQASALVLPLYRRGDPFGAIECLGKRSHRTGRREIGRAHV